ncbi:hypothetical protein ACQ4M4_09460 [Leptolyngbya sp. AN02str]|uniref:hypothetical protein n=1 Tax=Leptolyngbya sp. AN02str TaxID=3423363 RepID=UPI003D31E6B4
MTRPLRSLAQAGDPDAIAQLLNQALQPYCISAKVAVEQGYLWITLAADPVPDLTLVAPLILRGLVQLQSSAFHTVHLQGHRSGDSLILWNEHYSTQPQALLKTLAQLNDRGAIAHLLTRAVAHKHYTVHIEQEATHLHITLRSEPPPEPFTATVLLQREIDTWHHPTLHRIEVTGQDASGCTHWHETVPLTSPNPKQSSTPAPPAPPDSASSIERSPLLTSSQPPSHASPPAEWTFKFDPLKLGFISFLLIYGVMNAPSYTVSDFINGVNWLMGFLHGVNLIFHEAGHMLFLPFGRLMHLLGGSLMQGLVPGGIAAYFWQTRQPYAAAVALCWLGENFWDVSIYIKDAQNRMLPLLGGEGVLHDWHFILLDLRLLPHDQLIGGTVYQLGILIYAFALFMGVFYAQIQRDRPIPPNPSSPTIHSSGSIHR